jgi:hypothetical protein
MLEECGGANLSVIAGGCDLHPECGDPEGPNASAQIIRP